MYGQELGLDDPCRSLNSGYSMILMDISTRSAWGALMMDHSTFETLATPAQLLLLLQEPLPVYLGSSEPSPELRAAA